MRDVESDRQPLFNNPYSGEESPLLMGPYHPLNILYRVSVMGASLYGLHQWKVYSTVLRSPLVRHEWFKIGLAASIGKQVFVL